MVIEKFHSGKEKILYKRFEEHGRMLPEGIKYVDSWINESITVCYQVMESDNIEKIQAWINNWNDLSDFEIIPVISSDEAKQRVLEIN
jgi:hypothetical protein